jgi:hypothetical protein
VASPFKRRAKIFAKKLPHDFFGSKKMAPSDERSARASSRNEIHTQAYSRKSGESLRVSETREFTPKGSLTSRNTSESSNTMDLLLGIISSTR